MRIRKPDDAEKTHSGVIAVTALNAEIAVEELERKEEEAKALAREAEEKRSGKKKTEKKVEETEKKDENL